MQLVPIAYPQTNTARPKFASQPFVLQRPLSSSSNVRYGHGYQDPTPPPSIPDTPTAPSSTTNPTTPTESNMPTQTTVSPSSPNNMPTWINNLAFAGCCSKESPAMKEVTGGRPPAPIRPPENIPPGGTSIGLAWKGYTRFNTDRPETTSNPSGLSSLSGSPNSGPRQAGPNGVPPEPPNDTVAPSSANEPAPQQAAIKFSKAFQNTGPSAAGSAPNPSGVSPGAGGKSGGNLFAVIK